MTGNLDGNAHDSLHHFIAALLDAGMPNNDAESIAAHIWGRHGDEEDGQRSLYVAASDEIDTLLREISTRTRILRALEYVRDHKLPPPYSYETATAEGDPQP